MEKEKPARTRSFPKILLEVLVVVLILIILIGLLLPMTRGSCVVAGTPIETPAGPRQVELLAVGDQVICRSSDGRIAEGKITAVQCYTASQYLRFRFDDGRELCVTAEHPIFGESGWQRAGSFAMGDSVVAIESTLRIESIRVEHGPVSVYDLTVEPHENFFASGILVHNKGSGKMQAAHFRIYELLISIKNFKMDYNQYPWPDDAPPMGTTMADVLRELAPTHPGVTKGKKPTINTAMETYFEVPNNYLKNGTLVDPWGGEYMIIWDDRRKGPIIWTKSRNGIDETSDGDEDWGDDIFNAYYKR